MSTPKFAIIIEVKNGKPVATAFNKTDAGQAVEQFVKLRDEGKEAYLFQHPVADKRSKSKEQMDATSKATNQSESKREASKVESAKVRSEAKSKAKTEEKPVSKNSIEGVSMDAVDIQ